ncbi:MAG TPA: hypothetical protein VE955_05355 [Candidatus Dormibacteraeota bacterium]|jgi:hypothetical protein|nr:hypothetical protein [Candidatus Dormibacteraeota bacterium]
MKVEKIARGAATVEEEGEVMVEEADMVEAEVEVEATVGEEDMAAVEAMVAAEIGTEALSKIAVQSLSKKVKRLT